MSGDFRHIPYSIRHLARLEQECHLLVFLLVAVPTPLVDLRRGQVELVRHLPHEAMGPVAMFEIEAHQLMVLLLSLYLMRALSLHLPLDPPTCLHEGPARVKAHNAYILGRKEVRGCERLVCVAFLRTAILDRIACIMLYLL